MAPGAIHNDTAAANGNGTALKPTARSFHPTGTPDPSKYHASSSQAAIKSEADFAAHNYHPLPIVQYSQEQADAASGTLRASTISTSSPRTVPSTRVTATPSLSRLSLSKLRD
ncbi:Ornithine aminotransferase [Alternaria alternata]|nr:Ornithine aminotransferase [Alternaria alternata]